MENRELTLALKLSQKIDDVLEEVESGGFCGQGMQTEEACAHYGDALRDIRESLRSLVKKNIDTA